MTYLSRNGQSHGPFTEEQIHSMQTSGEILSYQWMWPAGATSWQPIAPPPPPAPMSPPAEGRSEQQPEPAVVSRRPAVQTYDRHIEAICHDQQNVVAGTLQRVTDEGCELVSEDEHGPAFTQRSSLLLNLIDSQTGRSMNVKARLSQAGRREGHWFYRLRWDECPEVLVTP